MAATNEDLEAAIARGTFRADLYHRINSFTLRMPCLRQMRGDIPLFADFFLDQANRELDKRIVGVRNAGRRGPTACGCGEPAAAEKRGDVGDAAHRVGE